MQTFLEQTFVCDDKVKRNVVLFFGNRLHKLLIEGDTDFANLVGQRGKKTVIITRAVTNAVPCRVKGHARRYNKLEQRGSDIFVFLRVRLENSVRPCRQPVKTGNFYRQNFFVALDDNGKIGMLAVLENFFQKR